MKKTNKLTIKIAITKPTKFNKNIVKALMKMY